MCETRFGSVCTGFLKYVLYETVLGVKAMKWDFQLCNFSSKIHFSATNAKIYYSQKWREHSIITWYDIKSFKLRDISLSFHLKLCCKWKWTEEATTSGFATKHRSLVIPPPTSFSSPAPLGWQNDLQQSDSCMFLTKLSETNSTRARCASVQSPAPCSSSTSAWEH